jgi:uncharacterized protein
MKSFRYLTASALALITFQASPGFAQAPAPPVSAPPASAPPAAVAATIPTRVATPALWQLKDHDTTIYLFGTVHLLPEGIAWHQGAVKTAFERADLLKLEIANIDAETPQIAAIMAEKGRLPEGQKLADGLSESQKAALDSAIKDSGIPAPAFENARPWLASMLLAVGMMQKMGMDPNRGVDKTLDSLARASGKPVEGFETGAEQISFFANLSPSAERAMLLSTLEDWSKGEAMMRSMVDGWVSGNTEAVGRMMNESLRNQPEFGKALLTDRNERWANWIAARMAQPGTVFVAVGAGHLEGPDSVQAFLKTKGMKAKRVTNRAVRP